jgi:hypothetical protein
MVNKLHGGDGDKENKTSVCATHTQPQMNTCTLPVTSSAVISSSTSSGMSHQDIKDDMHHQREESRKDDDDDVKEDNDNVGDEEDDDEDEGALVSVNIPSQSYNDSDSEIDSDDEDEKVKDIGKEKQVVKHLYIVVMTLHREKSRYQRKDLTMMTRYDTESGFKKWYKRIVNEKRAEISNVLSVHKIKSPSKQRRDNNNEVYCGTVHEPFLCNSECCYFE